MELESRLSLGGHDIKNISYFELNQYERGVPGQPPGNPRPGVEAATGIGDLLTAFWISKRISPWTAGKRSLLSAHPVSGLITRAAAQASRTQAFEPRGDRKGQAPFRRSPHWEVQC